MVGPLTVPHALRPYVVGLVGYDVVGPPGVHRGLPGTSLTFVLPIGAPLDVAWSGDPGSRRASWSSVAGLHAAPAEIRHDGHQEGLFLALTTAEARALLGLPAAAIAGQLLSLDDLAPRLRHLPEQLHDASTWPERAGVLHRALATALSDHAGPGPRAEVGRALARLARGVAVAEVAHDVGYSRRHLRNLVVAETGLSPKEYQRVARFEASRDRVLDAARRGGTLAGVAAACGYADQAHLAREWRDLAGCPPTTWLREEFPDVQAGGVPAG
ncbi:helix-turn-helix domain-containing protein [Nocardioides lijunqiniae]|uniref:helix-turn-helix domain-containing protein n=1 Tax=Nocardioides lijunqiniae TaxID=2760832 RepID=UPI001877B0DA|nr:AraC family transcriptional regulator [Nocardioides lijunqiniae]